MRLQGKNHRSDDDDNDRRNDTAMTHCCCRARGSRRSWRRRRRRDVARGDLMATAEAITGSEVRHTGEPLQS